MRRPRRFSLAQTARGDLSDNHAFISSSDLGAADKFLRSIATKIEWLAQTRFPGVPRDNFSAGLKALPFGNYGIYFRITQDDEVIIVRIVHSARDIGPDDFTASDT
ncbi:type II toxin-antitoxin system RelE/ParE family toxin [Georhizobium profundi]|uniref:Type II toxin-antitoxin system RelE/ParE family toxin n=1 Tax=Georhizobium profundi TaxID=2341112 RepID=A0A3Q8XQ90_9HYPH|nr:type II toxin-antitoxin system RelE/ParE family toxin [Georhizobium profundi]AZN72458.1 type II toxin-antitoxin system RelE/ParE family toxin [Georhizobium profundi]